MGITRVHSLLPLWVVANADNVGASTFISKQSASDQPLIPLPLFDCQQRKTLSDLG